MMDPRRCHRALAARDARFDGRFFVGVASTGVYCRPVCPARTPRLDRCRFFPSAAAAQEAGFRPCLRCRPECAPGRGAWNGTSATVTRALALIDRGALDGDGGTEALADKLGVGGRHLRRLFSEHVGASPVQVAQTRRVLLAKRLLHETRLPMTQVAMAAGFGSLRRFNETFRALFGKPPSAIRGRRGPADGAAMTLTLAYRPPYDWAAALRFLEADAIEGLERVEGGAWHRRFAVDGAPGQVSIEDDAANGRLLATIRLPRLDALGPLIARLRATLDLDADPTIVAAHLARDPALATRVEARPGLRLLGGWDPFEVAVRAVLGQQVSLSAARKLGAKLVALASEGGPTSFPDPARLLALDLERIGMPAARRRALRNIARAALDDPTLFTRATEVDHAIARLTAISGVGPWTASVIAMRGIRHPDAFPETDVGLLRVLLGPDGERSAEHLRARAEGWRPWRGYAAMHLWADTVLGPLTTQETPP